ncbi:MAG TPA: hypothetical protein VKS01_12330 [Bryobacteraceae bacterium]|nr:hypothetical protein [Bryobacteraceae bacterium]
MKQFPAQLFAPRLKLQNGNEVGSVDERLVLGSFVMREIALVRLFGQKIHSRLHTRIDAEFRDAPRRFRVKAVAQRLEKRIEIGRGSAHTRHVNTIGLHRIKKLLSGDS